MNLCACVCVCVCTAASQVINSLSRFCYTLGDVTGATAQAFLPQCYRPNPDGRGGVTVDAPALQATVTGILKMTGLVASVAAGLAWAVPVLKPGWFTPDPAVASLMAKAAPFAALGMLLHPSVRNAPLLFPVSYTRVL
jgi:hypothetical protein